MRIERWEPGDEAAVRACHDVLLVKAAMLQWLTRAEPLVRTINTGNADSNRHMIAINEALGFRVLGPGQVNYDKIISSERIVATA